ncbi:hypothetical protein GE09DRAFT_25325 [Coniochaeta sp. 2T2.1]|nr:hypothetical protein GE09DRAFT_25325 [Coniochaeta sp. 2T2.1]
MKTAKPPATEPATGSSRRAQPVRRTRTNPARTTGPSNGPNALNSGQPDDQPIDIFPAVTHFTDAITALPKELVRHFTLLKEVDAKIFAPEESLFKLIEAALNAPPPDPPRSFNDASSSVAPASAPMSGQNSSTGVPFNGHFPAAPSNDEPINPSLFDPSNLPRRQLYRQTAFKIQEMLVSLEEKNHVISTANEALQKQLGRIEDLWPHLEGEFSDEAKWGSTTHWAYLENRIAKANNNSQAERSRREGAATLSAAAQQLAEEAAARSSDRKQALAAKKNSKTNQPNDADADSKPQEQASRKSQATGKSRKPAGDGTGGVGLGISNIATANGANPPPKRRKVDKQAQNNSGAGVETAMSSVFGPGAAKPKTTSPSGTPGPEGTKKRKALPTSSTQAKKSRTTAAVSPSVAGSPLIGTFPAENSKVARASPAPSSTARPSSSRARPTTAQPSVDAKKPQPPPTTAPSKPDDPPAPPPDAPVQTNGTRAASEAKVQKEVQAPPRPGIIKAESEPQIAPPPLAAPNGGLKDSTSKALAEESEAKKESNTPIVPPKPQPTIQPPASPATSATPVMTKSGRASKPSTPSMGTFAEAATARSRPSRASENPSSQPKRSHKKGASAAAAAAAATAMAQAAAAKEEDHSKADSGQDDDEDGDEPTYCYCNNVSYGEMVACDAEGCKREWFHLECVGLKVAPKGNAKWYCEDCKKRLRLGSKTVNGR